MAQETRAIYPEQELLAIAVRVDAASAGQGRFPFPSGARQRLLALDGYPFSDKFTLDCRDYEIGSKLDLSVVGPLSDAVKAEPMDTVGIDHPVIVGKGQRLHGWGIYRGRTPECVLIVDRAGRVVGAGIARRERPEIVKRLGTSESLRPGVEAVAPSGIGSLRVIGVFEDTLIELGVVGQEHA